MDGEGLIGGLIGLAIVDEVLVGGRRGKKTVTTSRKGNTKTTTTTYGRRSLLGGLY